MARILLLLFTINIIFIITTNGERTKDKMYESIEGSAACFRRLNATHQTGCTSKRPSSVGVIHIISDLKSDIDFVLKDGLAPPYVLVMAINEFSTDLVDKLSQYPSRVAGVVLHTNISRPMKLSHESTCPNSRSNLKDSCPKETWNPWGTSLLHADIPFPVFAVRNESELEKLEACWHKWNSWNVNEQPLRALCSVELAAFMFATRDSKTCIRRSASVTTFTPTRFCDPLGSRNAWATLWPRNNVTSNTDTVLVTARLDATSMFYDITPGADAHLTGLVTLLTTAYMLKQMVKDEKEKYQRNIMFVLFNGEGYDYIGSQRFVYDLMNPGDPKDLNDIMNLRIGDIKLIVELSQLNLNENNDVYLHHVQSNTRKSEIDDFSNALLNEGNNYNLKINNIPSSQNILPPSSLHSFLRERSNLQGVVLTNHKSKYENKFYHSLYDNAENIGYVYYNGTEGGEMPTDSIQSKIANLSKSLAKVLYKQATGNSFEEKNDIKLKPETIVDELLHCYLDTAYCKMFLALAHKELLSETPLPSYVSVDTSTHKLTSLTGYTLAWLTADHTNMTKENCTADTDHPSPYQYFWVAADLDNPDSFTCLRTTMHFSLALSPAFTIENYDWNSNQYSTWTESVWSDVFMRMFLTPSHRHEIMTISVGTVTFVLSLALVYFVHTRADILFAKPDVITPGTSC